MSARVRTKWLALALTVVMIASGFAVLGAAWAATGATGAVSTPAAASTVATTPSSTGPSTAATGPTSPAQIAPPPTPYASSHPSTPTNNRGAAVVAALAAKGISPRYAYLPDYAGIGATGPGASHVNLTYTTSPAPYGIGDFGLRNNSGTIVPYVTDTTSVMGTFSTSELQGYSPDLSSPDEYGVQLNAVLSNVTLFGTTGYQFWTQNVFDYTPSNQSILFVSNVWNFSSPGGSLSCNVFYNYGGNLVCPEYYYGLSAEIPATTPYSVALWVNSTLNQGRNEVFFNYSVSSGAGTFGGTYDYVIFNSLAAGENPALTPAAEYQANGYHTAGLGLPSDFEITLGGPGGGSNFDVFLSVDTYMTLSYLNGTTGLYQSVDSAYNVGGETGETSIGVLDDWSSFLGCTYCALLSNGPSFSYGLWNVSGQPAPLSSYDLSPYARLYSNPMTAFIFIAQGAGVTNPADFQWAPEYIDPSDGITLAQGEYTVLLLAAEYDPVYYTIDITSTCIGAGCEYYQAMTADLSTGVYTPLWAFNESAVPSISSGIDAFGNYQLFNNQYTAIGQTPYFSGYGSAYFPFFGDINDWMFPVFPGIYLNDTEFVTIANPPSFLTYFPTTGLVPLLLELTGSPTWNDLQIYVQDSTEVDILGGTIGGWFTYESYFGPGQSIGSVTFWNVTESAIENVAFQTGAMGLFLYGGSYNIIYGNTFTTSIPTSPYPYATVAAYWGSIGLVDTDWGDAALYGAAAWETCDVCDEVANNLFDTDITATQTYTDPYTNGAPNQYPYGFSQAYNGPHTPGANIIGGSELGGNYWWDYGLGWNPYSVIPYAGINPLPYLEGVSETYAYICESIYALCDYGGGDFYPLTYSPIFTATFEESGLPAGTEWGVGTTVGNSANLLDDLEAGVLYNYSIAPATVNLADPAGTYDYLPYSANSNYAAVSGTFTIVGANITVMIDFATAYTLTVTESGLPAGTEWTVTATGTGISNSSASTSPSITVGGLLPGEYNWTATTTAAYSAVPSVAEVTISGDTFVTVTFVGQYSLTVTESGLPTGATWYVSYASTNGDYTGLVSGTGTSITIDSLPGVAYNWSVAASGFVATPTSGSITLSSDSSVTVVFAASDATGTISGTVSPTSGTLYVDGSPVALGSGGTFSVNVGVGVHSIQVTSSGYVPYFNNVSVTAGQTTNLAIALTSSSTTAATGIGTLGWLLIAVLAIVAVILLVTTLVFARRSRPPPPVAAYNPPPAAAGSPPPAAWQEPPSSPPPS